MSTQKSNVERRILFHSLAVIAIFAMSYGGVSNAQTAPSGAVIQPYPGAPLCPSHNDTEWHGLWDEVRGCHYDHTHDDDPGSANAIFGPVGAAWGGQSISYPFMTPNENNQTGHPGYKYFVNLNPLPVCAEETFE